MGFLGAPSGISMTIPEQFLSPGLIDDNLGH